MKAENPAALRFILQDDIYLLQADKNYTAPTPAMPAIETPAVNLNYLGGNKKKFLVVVHYADNEFIAEAHLTALENILKRKDHSLDDVAIFNVAANTGVDFEELSAYFEAQKILIMGSDALPAKMDAPALNQHQQLANAVVLYSFSFDEMMSSTDNKLIFWEQMKNL